MDGFPLVAALLRMLTRLHHNRILNKKTTTSTQQVRQAKVGHETYPVWGASVHPPSPLVAALLRVLWLVASEMVF